MKRFHSELFTAVFLKLPGLKGRLRLPGSHPASGWEPYYFPMGNFRQKENLFLMESYFLTESYSLTESYGGETFPDADVLSDVGLLLLFGLVSPGLATLELPGPVAAGPVALFSSASVVLSELLPGLLGLVEDPGPLPGPLLPGP